MPFQFKRLQIPEVILIEPKIFQDDRGFFIETYKQFDFAAAGISVSFVQDNFVSSLNQGVLRGLHYQLNPCAQGKLIMVLSGEIFDVAVDIRKNSPWYGKSASFVLSEKDHAMLYIPTGFAHGYCVLSKGARVLYKCTAAYEREKERGIRWNDPDIAIQWPVTRPALSPKDKLLPFLADAENNFFYG